MILQPIEYTGATVVSERRYRRSETVTEALAYQCAHIRDGLDLSALVVTDDLGDRWVGAGDRALCRMLSKAAPDLARTGTQDAEFRIKALRSLQSDLTSAQLSTCAIRVPGRDRYVYVTGIGNNKLRTTGVMGAASGTRRILGFVPSTPVRSGASDADGLLQSIVSRSFEKVMESGLVVGPTPRKSLTGVDDGVYRGAVRHILAPAWEALARSGVVARDPWRSLSWFHREADLGGGIFARTLTSPLREARSGLKLGELSVRVVHRHDFFDLPSAPEVHVRWR
jgi:hypothetical protein